MNVRKSSSSLSSPVSISNFTVSSPGKPVSMLPCVELVKGEEEIVDGSNKGRVSPCESSGVDRHKLPLRISFA